MPPAVLFADFGNAVAWGLLALMVTGLAAVLLSAAPPLMAVRHGWRWTTAMVMGSVACGVPLRLMLDADDIAGEAWGLVSFPLWLLVAVVARRGPPVGSFLQSRYEQRS